MTGGKPFQSKLNPFFEVIRSLRDKRTPYPEIARILREEHGLEVGPTTVFDFVKVRSKKRDVYAIPLTEGQEPAAAPPVSRSSDQHSIQPSRRRATRQNASAQKRPNPESERRTGK